MEAHVANHTAEIARRHRAAAATVNALLIVTIVLMAVGYIGRDTLYKPGGEWIVGALRITILFFALGAIVLRRTKFQAMRLQDIAALRGISGLLGTLQGTTVEIACMALAIALLGFISTILTGNFLEVLRAGLVAIVLFIYCYPKRQAWERVVHGIETTGDANDSPRGVNA